jgi:hypothetical protein
MLMLITTAGKALIAGRINGSGSPAAATAIGLGTGAVAAAAGNTTLGTEVTTAGAGASGVHAINTAGTTVSLVTTTTTNDTAQWVGTATFSATIAVTESGVFNADTNGTMLNRQVFSAINVVSGDSIQFTHKVAVA